MGSKFTTTAISGYNASPPADDGSAVAANQLQWSKHINKIGDPLKTLVESINTKLVTFTDFGSRSTTVSDTTVASDHMKTVEIASTATSGVTISLGDAVSMTAGYIVSVKNLSVHTQTIGRITTADGIDGVLANLSIGPKSAYTFKVAATASNGYYSDSFLNGPLVQDAADTLAIRNGTNPQLLYIYNTFTNSSNYERGVLAWASNQLFVGTDAAGTGSARVLTLASSGTAGTRLRTNSTDRWLVDGSGHITAFTDNTLDIGAAGATRPRSLFLGTNITTGAPAGGTAAAWKLGTVAVVSPTSPNRTIEVEVGGTIYYLHAKTTNN